MKKIFFMAFFASACAFTNAQTSVIGGDQNNSATKEKTNAGISFRNLSHNFGTIIEGQIATYDFKFKNNGTEPLKLSQVKASCGCTTPKYPTTEIMPGDSANIRAEYNSNGRPGTFNKNIFVTSNAGDVTLTILGNVVKEPEKPISPIIIR